MKIRLVGYIALQVFALGLPLLSGLPSGQAEAPANQTRIASVERFLVARLGPDTSPIDRPLFQVAFVDLNRDGREEALVRPLNTCGSGECNLYILTPNGPHWKLVSNMTITQWPIRVLSAMSHGWHNIGIWVSGGGTEPPYEAELRFDGKRYPLNPSTPPARRAARGAKGTVVLSEETAFYPLGR